MDFFDRLDSIRARWNVLEHPFYQRWNEGRLERDELAFYAAEYRHAVIALAESLDAAAAGAAALGSGFDSQEAGQIGEHAAEEAEHVALWEEFASVLGADVDRSPRPETQACRESWTAGRDALEGLVAAFTIESGQPAVAETKLRGLLGSYGFQEGPATEYFSLHAELDHEHAAQARELIDERLADADLERLLAIAEGALKGNWDLLDGVERHFGR